MAHINFRTIDRAGDAFQEPVSVAVLQSICDRVFGPSGALKSAVELGLGMYNNTYLLDFDGAIDPVILRVAPRPDRQSCSERELMRNEYATLPFLASLGSMIPRVVAADWSHDLVGRDYMIQTVLPGVPAPERLPDYPRGTWRDFYRQIGVIARRIHDIEGPHFGAIAGTGFRRWSEAFVSSLLAIADDLDRVGLPSSDIRAVVHVATARSAVLDEIDRPRLLAGDLWTVNVMVAEVGPTPTITGVLDLDRTLWGDPAADWTLHMAHAKQDEREAFWESYGQTAGSAAAIWRTRVYDVRHLAAIRLEHHRLGETARVEATYSSIAAIVAELE
jgi:aminoglycoside phosphotransferase (APT) family kinase protein